MRTGVAGPPGAGSRRRRRAAWKLCLAPLLAAVLLLSACTYSDAEPGLFGTEPPRSESEDPLPPQPANLDLPVAGDAVWTTSEGLSVTSRFAVHAVRRIDGATVLDWSVTPLRAPGLAAGEQVPTWVDLGLTRESGGDVNIVLIDPVAEKAYRPLSHKSRSEFNRCLCTPAWVAQLDLRIGETRLLQTTFPELPRAVGHLDVSMSTLPVFSHVPVSPVGQAPTVIQPTDLRRPPEEQGLLAPPYQLRLQNGSGPQRVLSLEITSITAGEHLTWMEWSIRSLTDQPSFSIIPFGPPIAAELPDDVHVLNPGSASGPLLQPSRTRGKPLSVRWMTASVQNRDYYECLCTPLGLWASSLRTAGSRASVITVYPALPPDTSSVDVILPDATTLWRLPVSRAEDSAAVLGPSTDHEVSTWEYRNERPPGGWGTGEWPTPVPESRQLSDYESFVERLTTLPAQ